MKAATSRLLVAAVVLGAASLSACHDDHSSAGTPPPTGTTEAFSTFATKAFQAPANGTPLSLDNITILFDVNEDPNAFNALLMM